MSQCALGPDGDLRDASEITWYHDIDDAHPISGPTTAQSVGHCPQHTAHLTERLRDPNNTEAPGLVSQRKAVERYRAAQATIQASTSTSGTPSTRTIQSSYDAVFPVFQSIRKMTVILPSNSQLQRKVNIQYTL